MIWSNKSSFTGLWQYGRFSLIWSHTDKRSNTLLKQSEDQIVLYQLIKSGYATASCDYLELMSLITHCPLLDPYIHLLSPTIESINHKYLLSARQKLIAHLGTALGTSAISRYCTRKCGFHLSFEPSFDAKITLNFVFKLFSMSAGIKKLSTACTYESVPTSVCRMWLLYTATALPITLWTWGNSTSSVKPLSCGCIQKYHLMD